MKQSEYFLSACRPENGELYRSRDWVMSSFCLPVPGAPKPVRRLYPYMEDGKWMCLNTHGEPEVIDDADPSEPVIPAHKYFQLAPGDVPNNDKAHKTTYGVCIANLIMFVFPFERIIPYQNKTLNGGSLETIIEDALRADNISVPQYIQFTEAMGYIDMFSQVLVPSITARSITVNPASIKRRKELYAQYKDRLHEPAIAAMYDTELTKLEKEYLKGDPAERFLLSGKSYGVVRKNLYASQGGTAKFDDPSEMDFVYSSLMEGLKPEDIPVVINKLRSGSYDRGASTALGGYEAKVVSRIFQNLKIAEDDCRVEYGHPFKINQHNYKQFIGRYTPKSTKGLTADTLKTYIGKELIMRYPGTCKTKSGNLCRRCMGDIVGDAATSLTSLMAAVASRFLSIFLAAFHGSQLKTQQLNFDEIIT